VGLSFKFRIALLVNPVMFVDCTYLISLLNPFLCVNKCFYIVGNQIIPEKCKYQVLSTKVEIRLAKAEQVTWTTLDYSGRPKTVPQKISTPGNKSFRTIATHHV
jgi:hypothetical protein